MTNHKRTYPFILIISLTPIHGYAEKVLIGDFSIDRYEVTVGSFMEYAKRKGIKTQAEIQGGGFEWGFGWERRSGWSYKAPQGAKANDDEPAVHITWSEANEFCLDKGGRLPNQEEWSLAAYTELRDIPTDGFETGRTYPYPIGDSPSGMNNNQSNHLPVGSTKKGVNGLYDMGANVWEWLSDRDDQDALTAGGSWWYGPHKTRLEGMQYKPASFYAVYIGFRCVY